MLFEDEHYTFVVALFPWHKEWNPRLIFYHLSSQFESLKPPIVNTTGASNSEKFHKKRNTRKGKAESNNVFLSNLHNCND